MIFAIGVISSLLRPSAAVDVGVRLHPDTCKHILHASTSRIVTGTENAQGLALNANQCHRYGKNEGESYWQVLAGAGIYAIPTFEKHARNQGNPKPDPPTNTPTAQSLSTSVARSGD